MNLIWQFHVEVNRAYDGKDRLRMTQCSASTVSAYALKIGCNYMLETRSKYHLSGVHGGPAIDRFQLIEEKYDEYNYILYLDTDILIGPNYKDIFKSYADCDVAGHNILHKYDAEVLANGWLKGLVDPDRYKKSYFHGDIILLSREFRQWLRKNVNPLIINQDKGKHWTTHHLEVKWPVYDQSMMAYWLSQSPFSLTPLADEFISGPSFIHEGGGKSETTMKRFFTTFDRINSEWSEAMKRT